LEDKAQNPVVGSLICPRCGRRDIVPSMPRNFIDELMRSFGKLPKHCRGCGKRFYVRETGGTAGGAA
jgi:hypothetical protein